MNRSFVTFGLLVTTCAIVLGSPVPAACAEGLELPLAGLPAEDASRPLQLMRFEGVTPGQAQVLFACSTAAVYLWDRGEVWLLADDDLEGTSRRAARLGGNLGKAMTFAKAEPLGPVTLAELAGRIRAEHPDLEGPGSRRYLAMVPTHRPGPVPVRSTDGPRAPAQTKATILSEGFEGNPWSRWERDDNTGGDYTWGTTTCDMHSGSYSADAVRGGTIGGTLSCTASYSNDLTTSMTDGQCEDIYGASQAWLDLYLTAITEAGYDGFGIFFDDGLEYWGYIFSGTFSGWWHIIYNLKQWYGIGDLTQLACNHLMIAFLTDYSITPGFGLRVDDITIRTGAMSGLSCSGSANPTSGQAPLTVSFNGTVSGASTSADISWSFGDGGFSTQTSTTHTYTDAGDYYPLFQVEDGNAICAATLSVTVTEPCSVSCSASVPGTGEVGVPVSFYGSATTSNCSGSPTFSWSFGDGSSSSLEDPTHAYDSAGSYSWRLDVLADGTSCSRTGTINIAGPQVTTYLVPGVAHAPGAAGTNWRTKLSVLNRSGATANVTLDYVRSSKTQSETLTLADGELRAWGDVAVDLFGISSDSSGAVVVTSTRPLAVGARTYNQGSSGTFGQYLPGVDVAQALASGETGLLSMLCKNSSFRTNIGFVNLGSSSCNVEVTLHASSGVTIGSPRTIAVPARGWKQDNDIFSNAGAGTCNDGYATVEVLTSGCEVWGYGSVVDNATGDPTTIPLAGASGGSGVGAPVTLISNLPGNDGTQSADLDNLRNKGMGFTMPSGQDYVLDHVTLRLQTSGSVSPIVQLWTSSGGLPGAPIETLQNPTFASSGIAEYDFTSSGAMLSAGQTYWIVAYGVSSAESYDWKASSPAQTPTGIASHYGSRYDSNGPPPTGSSSTLTSYSVTAAPVSAGRKGLSGE